MNMKKLVAFIMALLLICSSALADISTPTDLAPIEPAPAPAIDCSKPLTENPLFTAGYAVTRKQADLLDEDNAVLTQLPAGFVAYVIQVRNQRAAVRFAVNGEVRSAYMDAALLYPLSEADAAAFVAQHQTRNDVFYRSDKNFPLSAVADWLPAPTAEPTAVPTEVPTAVPTAEPTAVPTAAPTAEPTAVPTAVPTEVPTAEPTATPGPAVDDSPTRKARSTATYHDATSRITIYDQHHSGGHNQFCKLSLTSSTTMHSSGCLIFAHAHAVQWCTGLRYSGDKGVALMQKFIKAYNKPWEAAAHGKYKPIAEAEGLKKVSVPSATNLEKLLAHFNNGGVIVEHEPNWGKDSGHYILSVGYTYRDIDNDNEDDLLIHIVDSAVDSSASRFKYAGEKAFAFGTFASLGNGTKSGGQYWITYDLYLRLRHDDAFVPNYALTDSIPRIAASKKQMTGDANDDQCYIKAAPFEDASTNSVVAKNGVIYIIGAVKNKYGNIWYKTQNAGYVYSGDVEILEPDITNKSEESFSALGVSINKDCYLKDKPYEASMHTSTVAKNKTVDIVAKVVNKHGNLWYKTSDGKYVYSGDVDIYTMNPLCSFEAEFTNMKKRNSHVAPYVDSPEVKSIAQDARVTTTRFVTNGHGNIWAQLSDGSYLCFADFNADKIEMSYIGLTNPITVTDVKKPTGSLEEGKTFGIRGILKGKAPFYYVTSYLINRATGANALAPAVAKPSPSATSVNLNAKVNGVNINNITYFSKLPEGNYTYKVTAQLGFDFNGKSYFFGSEQTLITSDFQVGSPASPGTVKVTGLTLPSGDYPMGAREIVSGTVAVADGSKAITDITFFLDRVMNGETESIISTTHSLGSNVTSASLANSAEFVLADYLMAQQPGSYRLNITVTYMGGDGKSHQYDLGTSDFNLVQPDLPIGAVKMLDEPIFPEGAIPQGTPLALGGTMSVVEGAKEIHEVWIHLAAINEDGSTTDLPAQMSSLAAGTTQFSLASMGDILGFETASQTPGKYELYVSVIYLGGDDIEYYDVVLSSEFEIYTPASSRLPGDATDDGLVDMRDALRILKHLAQWDVEINMTNANVTGDDIVDLRDALRILKYLAQWDVVLL